MGRKKCHQRRNPKDGPEVARYRKNKSKDERQEKDERLERLAATGDERKGGRKRKSDRKSNIAIVKPTDKLKQTGTDTELRPPFKKNQRRGWKGEKEVVCGRRGREWATPQEGGEEWKWVKRKNTRVSLP